jgi:hypothetical protein
MTSQKRNPVAGDDRAPKRFRWAAETNSNHSQTPADQQARTARRRGFNAEARVQASIVEYVRAAAPETLVFHPANGDWRTPAEAARFRWLGVTAGVPDLVVIPPGGRAHFLEVKSERGSLSQAQRAVMAQLEKLGAPVAVVRSIDDVRRAFAEWGIETREARNG